MDSQIECHVCGEMNSFEASLCRECDSNLVHNLGISEIEDDCCMNCTYYNPASEIECPVLAKMG